MDGVVCAVEVEGEVAWPEARGEVHQADDGARVGVLPHTQVLERTHLLGVRKGRHGAVVDAHRLAGAEGGQQGAAHDFVLEQRGARAVLEDKVDPARTRGAEEAGAVAHVVEAQLARDRHADFGGRKVRAVGDVGFAVVHFELDADRVVGTQRPDGRDDAHGACRGRGDALADDGDAAGVACLDHLDVGDVGGAVGVGLDLLGVLDEGAAAVESAS